MKNKKKSPDKSMIMRIVVLAVCAVMCLGVLPMPFFA
jgi:hypothetical protein